MELFYLIVTIVDSFILLLALCLFAESRWTSISEKFSKKISDGGGIIPSDMEEKMYEPEFKINKDYSDFDIRIQKLKDEMAMKNIPSTNKFGGSIAKPLHPGVYNLEHSEGDVQASHQLEEISY